MFLIVTLFLFWTILIIVAIHYAALFRFLYQLKQTEWNKSPTDFTPKTIVLFPLRGADPSLPRCLEKILTQHYPNYLVRFILDSPEDSALPLVESAIKQWGGQHAEIKIMTEHFPTCSLKCSAHHHGLADLDPSYEVAVILDADTHPPSDWLRRLIEPFSDPRFVAATGLRWYIPDQANAGSLVRYLWNAAAVVQHELYRIPWGGSLALRHSFLTESGLLERWKHTFTEDTPVTAAVRKVQGKIALVPSLFIVNRESCGLPAFHRWVKRQMLCARLYHPAWGAILGQAVLLTVPLLLLLGTFMAGFILGDVPVALWSAVSFILYWAGVFGTVPIIENAICRIVRQQGETVEKWTPYRTFLTFAMVPVTQGVYTSALFWLHFLRKVEWRGIEYEIRGKQIRMVEYKPYTVQPAEQEEGHSL